MFAGRFQNVALGLVAFAILLTVAACNGGSSGGGTSFTGIKQTYVVAAGNRQLALTGRSGTYTTTTSVGSQVLPVSLDETQITVGALSFPYLAKGKLLIGGGYSAFAANSVVSDPSTVPGSYVTMTGANFAGQLTIDKASNYVWCMRSAISGSACADGSTPNTGTTSVQPTLGFQFSGVLGTYAIYQRGTSAAIFPISAQSLRLMALTQTSKPPSGSFAQPLSDATGNPPLVKTVFRGNSFSVTGYAPWDGEYPYTLSNGTISFTSSQCPNNTCNAIYNNNLGMLFIARLGNALLIR